jgi:hypothetical protein
MIAPDKEIYEVEKRIAERRHRVEHAARETGRQALKALSSPWALAGAAAIGFIAAGGLHGRQHRSVPVDRRKKTAVKAGGIASIAMAAATWLIKSQFGSPVAMAQFLIARMKKPAQPSPSSDKAPATISR